MPWRVTGRLEFGNKAGDVERDKNSLNALAWASEAGSSADAATTVLKRDDPSQVNWQRRRLEGDGEDRSRSTFEI